MVPFLDFQYAICFGLPTICAVYIPVCPENKYDATHAIPRYIPVSTPKSSIPIKVHAIGVLVAPANTATNPMPAMNDTDNGMIADNALPKVAPTKKRGVTSPPLNPTPIVNVVKISFSRKSYHICVSENEFTMTGIPSPIYLVVPMIHTHNAMHTPPISGLNGA